MKKSVCFAALLLLLIPPVTFAQSRLRHLSFYSPSVGRTMRVVVLVPTDYKPARAYPVLYLLHGYGGDQNDWTTKSNLVSYTSALPIIIVMPEANNSWYVNSETNPKAKYENYIMGDLPRFIESHFRIDTAREAIAGLSMGGYGAVVLALRHPGKFQFVGDLSGAISIPQIIDSVQDDPHFVVSNAQKGIMPNVIKTFGKNNKRFRDDHNVFDLLARDPRSEIPYFYIAAGTNDPYVMFRPTDHMFIDSLHAKGVSYDYHERPGSHDWKFWNWEAKPMLASMARIMDLHRIRK